MPAPRQTTDQAEFDFLMPYGPGRIWLNPAEAARCLGGCTVEHIYDLIAEGKLEYQTPTEREKRRYKITRRSVLAALAERCQFEPAEHLQRVLAVLETLTSRADLQAALQQLGAQLQKAPR